MHHGDLAQYSLCRYFLHRLIQYHHLHLYILLYHNSQVTGHTHFKSLWLYCTLRPYQISDTLFALHIHQHFLSGSLPLFIVLPSFHFSERLCNHCPLNLFLHCIILPSCISHLLSYFFSHFFLFAATFSLIPPFFLSFCFPY